MFDSIPKGDTKMKKLMSVLLLAVLPTGYASAAYVERIPERISVANSGRVMFGTSNQPNNTCDNHSRYFRFDASTEGGKAMLAALLTAKASGSPIQIWYTPSTSPGTDCGSGPMAIATGVGMP